MQRIQEDKNILCRRGCGRVAKWRRRDGQVSCSQHLMHCPVARAQHADALRGARNPFFGKKFTSSMLVKFRASIGDSRKGAGNPMFGKARPKEVKAKISRSRVLSGVAQGARNPNWKGGRSFARGERYRAMQTAGYKNWRRAVFERDDYTCQNKECGHRGGDLEAHHVKPWSTFPELRYSVDNGLTLCLKCHRKTFKGCRTKTPR